METLQKIIRKVKNEVDMTIREMSCENCKHCYDHKYWSCDIDETCIDGSMFEPQEKENFNEIET